MKASITINKAMFVVFLLCLLPSATYAGNLQDLVSASNDFEVEMIEHERVLERNPSATELAASTLKYAGAKERYFVVLRESIPTLIDMTTGKTPKTPEVDKIREIFSGYGETQGNQIEAATVSMLKQRDQDAEVSKAEIEFNRVQKVRRPVSQGFRWAGLDLANWTALSKNPPEMVAFARWQQGGAGLIFARREGGGSSEGEADR
jgi:hypothetical protein